MPSYCRTDQINRQVQFDGSYRFILVYQDNFTKYV